jgi:hypothetical protein
VAQYRNTIVFSNNVLCVVVGSSGGLCRFISPGTASITGGSGATLVCNNYHIKRATDVLVVINLSIQVSILQINDRLQHSGVASVSPV